jgi:hypothetical protein
MYDFAHTAALLNPKNKRLLVSGTNRIGKKTSPYTQDMDSENRVGQLIDFTIVHQHSIVESRCNCM